MPLKIVLAPSFHRDYHKLPHELQVAIDKQVEFLQANIGHPSLRLKKNCGDTQARGKYESRKGIASFLNSQAIP